MKEVDIINVSYEFIQGAKRSRIMKEWIPCKRLEVLKKIYNVNVYYLSQYFYRDMKINIMFVYV